MDNPTGIYIHFIDFHKLLLYMTPKPLNQNNWRLFVLCNVLNPFNLGTYFPLKFEFFLHRYLDRFAYWFYYFIISNCFNQSCKESRTTGWSNLLCDMRVLDDLFSFQFCSLYFLLRFYVCLCFFLDIFFSLFHR